MKDKSIAEVGVFGGSGFYNFLKIKEEFSIDTIYGKPSDTIIIGELEGINVAFLQDTAGDTLYPRIKLTTGQILQQ